MFFCDLNDRHKICFPKHDNTLQKINYKLKTTESLLSRNQQVTEDFPSDFLNTVIETRGSFT